MKNTTSPWLFSLVGILLICTTCARNPVSGKKQLNFMSESQEISIGKESEPQILAEFGPYQGNPALQKFLSDKGLAMVKVSHRPNLPFKFHLVDSPVVNAFAAPGGYVYFTRGIMAHFNNEAQFAGVLGHEIGHVTARHAAEQYTKSTLAQVGLMAGMIASSKFQQYGDFANMGLQLLFLKFSRSNESQSDQLGVEYSSKIGYDAKEMDDFFLVLKRITAQATGGKPIPAFLSTHPDPGDRYTKVRQMAAAYQLKNKGTYKINRNEYLQMLEGLVYGEDPRQGYVENNVFYHPELKFYFPVPRGYKTQNSPSQFAMSSPDENAMMLLTVAGEKTLAAAASGFIQQYQLKLLDQQTSTINGIPVIIQMSEQVAQAEQGQATTAVRILTYYYQHGGNIYKMHGLSEAPVFEKYRPDFTATFKGFAELKDGPKLNVKPEVIRIKTLSKDQTLSEALKSFGISSTRLEEFAILNGRLLTDVVKAGTMIKTAGK